MMYGKDFPYSVAEDSKGGYKIIDSTGVIMEAIPFYSPAKNIAFELNRAYNKGCEDLRDSIKNLLGLVR